MNNNKKNILITGASDGIGAALANRYANSNTHIILLARNEEKLADVAKSCKQKNAQVSYHSADVSDTQNLQKLIAEIDNKYPIDLVICNAGVSSTTGNNGEAESWDSITRVIDTNVYGVLATLNPLINALQSRRSGQIVIISSLAAHYGMPITPAYCASKAAVKAYGESLRGWLKSDGIKVNIVFPGFVKSSMSDKFPADKPFMLSAEKAANIIYKGVENNRASISFPFPLNFGIWYLSILPSFISDWIMSLLYGIRSGRGS